MSSVKGAGGVPAAQGSRKPYTVVYYDDNGERQVIRRVPPPRLHPLLPQDEVRITRKRNDDWDEDDVVKVSATTERQPNTLRVEQKNGKHTFLSHHDVEFVSRNGGTDLEAIAQEAGDPIGSRYLLWP